MSPFVRTTALIGELRLGPSRSGCNSGVDWICWRRSGEALTMTQLRQSAATAMLDWVRRLTRLSPSHAMRDSRVLQFHCGNPPPAPEPRTLTIKARSRDCELSWVTCRRD